MPISQDRMISVIDAGRVYEAAYATLSATLRSYASELQNRALGGQGASPSECADLASRMLTLDSMNIPAHSAVRALDIERSHFDARAKQNASATTRQRRRRELARALLEGNNGGASR